MSRSWSSRVIASLFALACAVGHAQHAHAEPYRLAVLQLETDDVHDAFARDFTEHVRRAIESRSDYALNQTRVSLAQLSLGQDCATRDAGCLARIARALNVQGFLFGNLTHEGGVPAIVLRRFDLQSDSVDRTALATFASPDATPEELDHEAERALDQLLGPATASATTAEPAALPEPPPEAQPKVEAEPVPTSGSSFRKVAGFTLLGAAVLSAGMSVLSFVEVDHAQHNSDYNAYRSAVGAANPSVRDVCSEASANKHYSLSESQFQNAKSACSTGTTFEILQYVFLGTAVLTGGFGAVLLAGGSSEHPDQRASLMLKPHFSKNSVSLTARGTF